jgi:hypothetical protein
MSAPSNNPGQDPPTGSPPIPPREDWGWTRTQRLGLGILLAILIGVLVIQYAQRPARLDDPVVMNDGQMVTLPRRVDPNTATLAELTRISHIGEKLAAKIIEYREARKPLTSDAIVFHRLEDMGRIAGLGKSVLQQVRPYLQFPDDAEEAEAGDTSTAP